MKPSRNYFGESEFHHNIRKLLKRYSSDISGDAPGKIQILLDNTKKAVQKVNEFPSNNHIDRLRYHFIPLKEKNEFENKFVSKKDFNDYFLKSYNIVKKIIDHTLETVTNDVKNNTNLFKTLKESVINDYVTDKDFKERFKKLNSVYEEISKLIHSMLSVISALEQRMGTMEKSIEDEKQKNEIDSIKNNIQAYIKHEKELYSLELNTLSNEILEKIKSEIEILRNMKKDVEIKSNKDGKSNTIKITDEFAKSIDMITEPTETVSSTTGKEENLSQKSGSKELSQSEFRKAYTNK